jgi:dihydroxyacetone kinase-like protein
MAQLGVIALAFMMVLIAMIYTIGHISSCHINPAVTLALAAARKTPWTDVPGYLAAQFTGATAGALAIWTILEQPGLDAGLGVLSYPTGHTRAAFCAELIGTFLLVLVVFGTTTDSRATPGWYGLAIPAVVFAVITIAGPVTGAALNPARYLGPMLARTILGAGHGLPWHQAPTYLTATFTAGLLAAATYAFLGGVKESPAHGQSKPHPNHRELVRRPVAAAERPATHATTTVDATVLRAWIGEAAQLLDDNVHYLTHLDAVIGDADHGSNMRRGFKAAVMMLNDAAPATPRAVLGTAANAFLANLGGAAGPLYGTGFRQAADALDDRADITSVQLGVALQAALAGIQELGAAVVGDKTMVDAWDPAVAAYRAVVELGGDLADATHAAAEAAERGLWATDGMQARKGRASYIGTRSVGHQDPGAASTVLILRALATTIGAVAGRAVSLR